MAFTVKLQVNKSDKNRVSKNITDIKTLNGELKTATSIIDPVIIIETSLTDVVNCNYMTIPTFNRSYYITDITSVRNNLVQISCHVDVLQSYWSSIKENDAIIKKQENNWNLYLNDGSFRIYQNPQVVTREFPGGFNNQQFILAIAGS